MSKEADNKAIVGRWFTHIPSNLVVDGWDCDVGSSMILDVASIRHARRRDWP